MIKRLFVLMVTAMAIALLTLVLHPMGGIAQQNCDRSYPDFCITPPPPDLDCADLRQRNFTVRQPDPHRFDGDRDGIGCEAERTS
jgi:hypothetical protein